MLSRHAQSPRRSKIPQGRSLFLSVKDIPPLWSKGSKDTGEGEMNQVRYHDDESEVVNPCFLSPGSRVYHRGLSPAQQG